jgi:transcriptional regulator with XRE-family HTH domain
MTSPDFVERNSAQRTAIPGWQSRISHIREKISNMGIVMSYTERQLADRLTDLRRSRGWSLEDLAERTGISRATLSRIERGDTSPTAAVLGRLAAAFGVAMAELFGPSSGPVERLLPAESQPVWTDPETGFMRRTLTPAASGYRGAMIEGRLPVNATISVIPAKRSASRDRGAKAS